MLIDYQLSGPGLNQKMANLMHTKSNTMLSYLSILSHLTLR